ncbi:helix-turn-helix transcriptional regulator [Streptomyces sp. 796.1]|uniref:helix-turn-helix transcriptional regulator n=1 Tax=Streptomyces sp. 796.1 TaxID=3163029 RepID=UPI0039C93658
MNHPQSDLTRLLRAWRRRVNRDEVALPSRFNRRRKAGLTQEEVADLVGVSPRWYNRLETGAPGAYSDLFLEAVAEALSLDDTERHALFVHAVGRQPQPRPHVLPSGGISPHFAELVRRQPLPAYISDTAWDVHLYNDHAVGHMPWMKSVGNVMIWALAHPQARLQLVDWETKWARPMAAQLRAAASQHKDNPRLAQVIREVREGSEEGRRIYDDDVTVCTHPKGALRYRMPESRSDEVEAVWLGFQPLAGPQSMHFIAWLPTDMLSSGAPSELTTAITPPSTTCAVQEAA